jgi:hypothetical protein
VLLFRVSDFVSALTDEEASLCNVGDRRFRIARKLHGRTTALSFAGIVFPQRGHILHMPSSMSRTKRSKIDDL